MLKKILIISAISAAGAGFLTMRVVNESLARTFPEIDQKIARKAWRLMFVDACRQKLDISTMDDLEIDETLRQYVQKVS